MKVDHFLTSIAKNKRCSKQTLIVQSKHCSKQTLFKIHKLYISEIYLLTTEIKNAAELAVTPDHDRDQYGDYDDYDDDDDDYDDNDDDDDGDDYDYDEGI